jgi:hypothetical protein
MIGPIHAVMRIPRTTRTTAIALPALCLLALAGCQRSTHSHVQLVSTVPPAERSLTLGAGDGLGWEVRHQDAALAKTNTTDATRVATGQ